MEGPLVSVILCTYNNEDFLVEAIESILNQTYQNIEFIIVNDGSTDRTKSIIQNFKTEKIKYFEHQKNKGQEEAKNLGLANAKGKYIAYMDGDDISKKQRLSTQVEFLESHNEIGICSTGLAFFGIRNDVKFGAETDLEIRLKSLFSTSIAHPTCLIRSSVIFQNNIKYKKGFEAAEDYYFFLALLGKTKAYCIQKPLYRYRWHGENISIIKSDIQQENFKKISLLSFQKLLGIDFSKDEHEIIYSFFKGKSDLENALIVQSILEKKSHLKMNSKLSKRFHLFYYERLIEILNNESPKGFSTFLVFIKSGIWKELSLKKYFKRYLFISARCLYNSVK